MLTRYAYILLLTILAATLKVTNRAHPGDGFEEMGAVAQASSSTSGLISGFSNHSSISANSVYDRERRDLLETLDQVVDRENYYRSIFGHYSGTLNQMNLTIPPAVKEKYEIRVTNASDGKLRIEAAAISGADLASVDQFYHLKSNFAVPEPRPEYLRAQAENHLRELAGLPKGVIESEAGIYRGYFQFHDSFAVGVKAPVLGMRCSLGGEAEPHVEKTFYNQLGSDLEKIARSDLMEEGEDSDRRIAETPGDVASSSGHDSQHDLVIEKIGP